MKHQDTTAAAPFGLPGKRRAYSTRRLLTGVGVILALTFVLGFYFPVVNASEQQTEQVKTLAGEYRLASEAFEKTNERLASTQAKSDEFKNNLNKIDQAESSAKSALDELHSSVEKALKVQVEQKLLKVEKRKDHSAVVVEALYLVYPHKTFVHAQGATLLCHVARALPKSTVRPTEIVAHANGVKPSSRILEKQFVKSWQLSGMMAAEVAAELENCGVAGTALRAVGAAHFEGNPRDAKKSPARFEVLIYPGAD